jgi:xanthine dehydrogenase accessory factor
VSTDDPNCAVAHGDAPAQVRSRTPAEIAVATLAGLVADRSGAPGGFRF